MKIVLFGDSVTDAGRIHDQYGFGYVRDIASQLSMENPNGYEIINKGVGGNTILNLYERIKIDVWNLRPDVLSILIGINDIWHEISFKSGVNLKRYGKVYRSIIEETQEKLPQTKIILCEPFVLHGNTVDELGYETFAQIKEYAKVVKELADIYSLPFLPLQNVLDEYAEKFGAEKILYDGVHPTIIGAKIIADEWLKLFRRIK